MRERTSYKRNDSEKLGLGTRRTYWAVTENEEVVSILGGEGCPQTKVGGLRLDMRLSS